MPGFGTDREFFDVTFTALDARDAVVENREFNGCTFTGAQFAGAQFLRCKMLDCKFLNCDLSNVSFKDSTLRDVTFEDSKLLGTNWTKLAVLAHLICRRSVLNLANFSGVDLRRSRFEACTAREADFGHANLTEAYCQDTDFQGARFLDTNFTKADLRNALNYSIRPGDNLLKKTRFSLPEATSLLYGLDIILDD